MTLGIVSTFEIRLPSIFVCDCGFYIPPLKSLNTNVGGECEEVAGKSGSVHRNHAGWGKSCLPCSLQSGDDRG